MPDEIEVFEATELLPASARGIGKKDRSPELQAAMERRNELRREQYRLDGGKRRDYNQAWKDAHREQVREASRAYQRLRYANDPEYAARSRRSAKEWREANSERTKQRLKEWLDKHPNYMRNWERKNRMLKPEVYLFRSVKFRAKREGILFDLTVEDIVIPEFCPVLGIKLNVQGGAFENDTASVDRIIPHLGYVRHNIKVISQRANRIKQDATFEEVQKVADYVRQETKRVLGVK